ncbi:DUF4936 family protein [Undibacterium sp.]|uniref:DUF4936 family protein n=1 Tax=Undibacterium sp. TaxID=1914977 RepID=UPI00374DB7F6
MDCYIYYRAEAQHQQQVIELAGKLLQLLAQQTGVATELKRRPEAENGLHTWMEVYKNVPQDFDALMKAALQHSALTSLIADGSTRHSEYFLDIPPCA